MSRSESPCMFCRGATAASGSCPQCGRALSVEEPAPAHTCHARGCVRPVKPEMLMCLAHWRRVPGTLQSAVRRTYRRGQCEDKKPSIDWIRVASAAIAYVAILEGRAISVNERLALDGFEVPPFTPRLPPGIFPTRRERDVMTLLSRGEDPLSRRRCPSPVFAKLARVLLEQLCARGWAALSKGPPERWSLTEMGEAVLAPRASP